MNKNKEKMGLQKEDIARLLFVLMAAFLPCLELHESDVQMPLEKLWEGAEYCGRHPEAHPDSSPRVRHPPPVRCGLPQCGVGSPSAVWAPPVQCGLPQSLVWAPPVQCELPQCCVDSRGSVMGASRDLGERSRLCFSKELDYMTTRR